MEAESLESLWPQVERLLLGVSKPARYIGGEQGAQYPEHGPGRVAWLLLYPDTYEIGLPNQGLQILYEILNERPDAVAERSYAPWVDMEAAMRAAGVPLFSVEQHYPARSFDILAFNLSAELVYTNVLNLIDLAQVPLHVAARGPEDPLVIAGGHCAFNPEPLADFVDAFVMGDGEEVASEINEAVGAWLAQPPDRRVRNDLWLALAAVEGVYVPSLYASTYADGRLVATAPTQPGVPAEVAKRTVTDLADWPYPAHPLVPLTEVVHDRLNVEVFRGCTRGCRFCQAGMITRPVRERPAEQVKEMVSKGLAWSGHDEVTLTSLSTADFSGIEDTVRDIIDDPVHEGRVSVSLPSLRVDAFTVATAAQIQKVRRTGLTFAPEGGTWRMRQVINKLITEEDLYSAVDAAFSQGWRRVKLYFLIGLPTERDEDVLGIAELGRHCVEIGRRHQKSVTVTASVGGFVPKPHTPFQWFGQDTVSELQRKVNLLREATRTTRGLTVRWHDPEASAAEGAMSRGDRRMGAVIERVWRAGGTFQEWSERFDLSLWEEALAAEGLSLHEVAHRDRGEHEPLPWDHISAGLHRDFLWTDWQDALAEAGVEDCRWTPCYDCGACTEFGLEHVVASPVPPAGGSQGTGQDLAAGGRIPVRLISSTGAKVAGSEVAGAPSVEMEESEARRYRFRFTKAGKIRFTSHRDVARMWERALRRSRLPVTLSQGFNPHPLLSFGLALPTGCESRGEYLDARLDEARTGDVPLPELPGLLSELLPEGMAVQVVAPIGMAEGSLQQEVASCTWELEVLGVIGEELEERIERALAAPSLTVQRERKGRQTDDDVRPAIMSLALIGEDSLEEGEYPKGRLRAELATHPRSVRPSDLVSALGTDVVLARACRTHQWIERDGARFEPLSVGELGTHPVVEHAARRAS